MERHVSWRFGSGARVALIGALVGALGLAGAASASAAPPVVGTLSQLSGLAGCFSSNGASILGAGTCTLDVGLEEPDSAIVSPDGSNVYVASYKGTFGVFSRNTATGALTQLSGAAGCFAETSSAGCTVGRGMGEYVGDGRDFAISGDGLWLYVAVQKSTGGSGTGAILIFQRNPVTGALTQVAGAGGCITTTGASQSGPGTCQTDARLSEPTSISLSPDERFAYVTDYGNPEGIHVFARTAATGALSEVQCIDEEPASSGCSTGRVLGDSQSLAITPDGLHAYSGNYRNGISVLDRNPTTGLLAQKAGTAGCITDGGKDNTAGNPVTCTVGRVLAGAYPLTIAPNGRTLYVPASEDQGISIFHINADGTLTQLEGTNGCVTEEGKDNEGNMTCATARNVESLYGGQISPDGRSFYATSDQSPRPGGISTFSVNPATGVLTQLPGLAGCVTSDGTPDFSSAEVLCAKGPALGVAYELAISPDGSSVYVASDALGEKNGGLALFSRQALPVCSATSATVPFNTPTTVTPACASPNGEPVTISLAGGPAHGTLSGFNPATGTATYTPASGYSGPDSISYTATDGTNASAAAGTASITVSPALPDTLKLVGRPHPGPKGVTLTFSCQGSPGTICRGKAVLATTEHLLGRRPTGVSARHRTRRHRRAVGVGRRSFTVAVGRSITIAVSLNAKGTALLARFTALPADLTVTSVALPGAKPTRIAHTKVVLKAPKRHGHRHHG